MKQIDRPKFAGLLKLLAETYNNGKEPSMPLSELYFRVLEKYEIGQIETAVLKILESRVYNGFPKPAEIIEQIEGSVDDKTVIAWATVSHAILHTGAYRSVDFEDRTINAVIDSMGGWIELCSTPENEMVWKQKEFERLYKAFYGRRYEDLPASLPGIYEIENSKKGYESLPPVRIGAKVKPKQLTAPKKQLTAHEGKTKE